jgi:hypothetical protein
VSNILISSIEEVKGIYLEFIGEPSAPGAVCHRVSPWISHFPDRSARADVLEVSRFSSSVVSGRTLFPFHAYAFKQTK